MSSRLGFRIGITLSQVECFAWTYQEYVKYMNFWHLVNKLMFTTGAILRDVQL